MNTKQKAMVIFISVIILVASGCTPAQPLKCNINPDGYSFDIAGESGSFTDGINNEHGDIKSGQVVKITVDVNFDRVYEISKHKYHFTGTIITDKIANVVTYDITATGDTFDSPQTCKKP